MDDDLLIAAIAAGDDTALRALFSRHAPWLAARLRSVLPAPDVEDVLQGRFLAVWRGAGSYRRQGAAGGQQGTDPAEAALSQVALDDAVGVLGPEGSPDREVWRLMYGGQTGRGGRQHSGPR
jgi:RNA polymerase sigma-70 factor (ECF subfamily)